jgi:hypothetical protein
LDRSIRNNGSIGRRESGCRRGSGLNEFTFTESSSSDISESGYKMTFSGLNLSAKQLGIGRSVK